MTLLNNGPRLSKYITENIKLEPKPLLFLSLPHREALYGGAAGGMKQLSADQKLLGYGKNNRPLWKHAIDVSVGDFLLGIVTGKQ